jgi:hypothetical protein
LLFQILLGPAAWIDRIHVIRVVRARLARAARVHALHGFVDLAPDLRLDLREHGLPRELVQCHAARTPHLLDSVYHGVASTEPPHEGVAKDGGVRGAGLRGDLEAGVAISGLRRVRYLAASIELGILLHLSAAIILTRRMHVRIDEARKHAALHRLNLRRARDRNRILRAIEAFGQSCHNPLFRHEESIVVAAASSGNAVEHLLHFAAETFTVQEFRSRQACHLDHQITGAKLHVARVAVLEPGAFQDDVPTLVAGSLTAPSEATHVSGPRGAFRFVATL